MGRRKGSLNKKTLVKKGLLPEAAGITAPVKEDKRTDKQVVDAIVERFDVFERLLEGTASEGMNALIVSGSAGVGKSYTAEWVLAQMEKSRPNRMKHKVIRGAISAIGLYEQAHGMRRPGDVMVLDDADRIFDDEDGLNILKSLLDTSLVRKVSWYTDHARFKGEDGLPQEFVYEGSMVFLTNKNFQDYIDNRGGRYVEHMEALMSRSIYLDLKMHSRREVALWAKHLVEKNDILRKIGCTPAQQRDAVEWVLTNRDDLRELSIRTIIKLGRIMLAESEQWVRMARITLLRKD